MKLSLKICLLAFAMVLGGFAVAYWLGWVGKEEPTPTPNYTYNIGEIYRKHDPELQTAGITYMGIPIDSLWYNEALDSYLLTEENKEALKHFFVGKHEILAAYIPSDSTRIGQVFDECIMYMCGGELFCESPEPSKEEYVWIDGVFSIQDIDKLIFKGTIKTKFKDVAGGEEVMLGGLYEFDVYENEKYGVVCRLKNHVNAEDESFHIITIFLNKFYWDPCVEISEEEADRFTGRTYDE